MNIKKISPGQLEHIKSSEGFSSFAYPDGMASGKQLYSIGYGHQIKPYESYLKEEVISKDRATGLLYGDIKPLEDVINGIARKELNQAQFDQLVDFGFNTGSNALTKVLTTLNSSKDFNPVADHINLYVKTRDPKNNLIVSPVLVARRKMNALPFLSKAILAQPEELIGVGGLVIAGFILYFFI